MSVWIYKMYIIDSDGSLERKIKFQAVQRS